MEFLKRYGYIFLFIAAAYSFLVAFNMPERRMMYVSLGFLQFGAGVFLMNKSKRS